mgnify:CR=1 FL=1
MVNYNNALIYKLCCKDTNIKEVYIGSTTNFTRRKHNHKSSCINEKNKKYNNKKYEFIRNNGGWENWDMVLIEKVNCNDKLELHKIERDHIEKFNSFLNCNSPIINKKEILEYKKEYREKNRNKILEYREKNREEILKKNKEYYLLNKEEILKKNKEYREKNREEILQNNKEYYLLNKDKISKRKKEYYNKKKLEIISKKYAQATP